MSQQDSILVYTRQIMPDIYSSYLAQSVHLAYSSDGKNYKALNQNYGIIFASAEIDQNNLIEAKGVKEPYIFHTADGNFGIIAVRVNADGSKDQKSKGKILLWTSQDLIKFEEHGLYDLQKDKYVKQVMCLYNSVNKEYEIKWCDQADNYYKNTWSDLKDKDSISTAIPTSKKLISDNNQDLNTPPKAINGNTIPVDVNLIEKLKLKWNPLENVEIKVPDQVSVDSKKELKEIKATAEYNDGFQTKKQIEWDDNTLDFSTPGEYRIKGRVTQKEYDFPLAEGYADPVITKWEGKYYYVATNDNNNDIGIFVRKGEQVSDLFADDFDEYLILDYDKSRNLIQTFWAPEFHVIGGEMYIFFAVSGEKWGPQAHIMKLKEDGEITDPDSWSDPIRVKKKDGNNLTEEGITLDMTYFEADNTHYVVWSFRIFEPADTGSMLYIATIDPDQPWQLTSEPVLLSRPLFGWENNEQTINNEGPYAVVTDGKVFLTYSGGAADGYTYCLGLLIINGNENLLEPDNWEKSPAPVLSYFSVKDEYGPGHNAFYSNENGDLMMTYHALINMKNSKRCSAIRRVHFDIDNQPRFDMSAERDLKSELAEVSIKVKW